MGDYPARLSLNERVFDKWYQPAIHTEAVPTDRLLLSNECMMNARCMSDEISRRDLNDVTVLFDMT